MNAGRAEDTCALVLRTVDYGEADRIVTLLTDRFGKLSVLARGARKSRRRFAGSLEPFLLLEAQVALGRGELGRLDGAEVRRAFGGVLGTYERLEVGGRALELVREAIPMREPDARVFDAVVEFFAALDGATVNPEALLLAFRVRLMALLGFEPGFDVCARTGRRPAPEQAAFFEPAAGGIVAREAGGGGGYLLSGEVRAWLRRRTAAGWSADLEPWEPRDFVVADRALDAFVTARLGRPLSERPPLGGTLPSRGTVVGR